VVKKEIEQLIHIRKITHPFPKGIPSGNPLIIGEADSPLLGRGAGVGKNKPKTMLKII
jgi:hypothetical protein